MTTIETGHAPGLLERIVGRITNILLVAAALCLIVMIVLSVSDLVTRETTGGGVPGAIQYLEMALVGLTFLGLADAQRHHQHPSVNVLTARIRPRVASALIFLGYLIVAAFMLWATWRSTQVAIGSVQSGEIRLGTVGVEVWPGRIAVALGLFALALVLIMQAINPLLVAIGKRPPEKTDVVTDSLPAESAGTN